MLAQRALTTRFAQLSTGLRAAGIAQRNAMHASHGWTSMVTPGLRAAELPSAMRRGPVKFGA
jgi:hypothetical protein